MPPPDFQIYLASRSPRRQALLTQIGVRFSLVPGNADESPLKGEAPADYVRRLALEKARAGRRAVHPADLRPVLGADTAVVVDERILGKPRSREDALTMLRLLSGRTHRVLTAVALVLPGSGGAADAPTAGRSGEQAALSESRVTFRTLDGAEMLRYWHTGEPQDKAGGYAIQGIGAMFVSALEGSYSGVMGLPLFETARLLAQAGIDPLAEKDSGVVSLSRMRTLRAKPQSKPEDGAAP